METYSFFSGETTQKTKKISSRRTCECDPGVLSPDPAQGVLRDAGVVSEVPGLHRADGQRVAAAHRHHGVALAVAQLQGTLVPVDLKNWKVLL